MVAMANSQAVHTAPVQSFPNWYIGAATVAMLAFFSWVGLALVNMQSTQAAMLAEQRHLTESVTSLQASSLGQLAKDGMTTERLQAVEWRLDIIERTIKIPNLAMRRDHTETTIGAR